MMTRRALQNEDFAGVIPRDEGMWHLATDCEAAVKGGLWAALFI